MTRTKSTSFFLSELYFVGVGLGVAFLFVFYLIIFIPTIIFRPLARYVLRPFFRPDLKDIVPCMSSALAQVDEGSYIKSMIIVQGTFKGLVSCEELVAAVEDRLVKCKMSDGSLRYPELQCYMANWVGYKWFKPEKDFNVRRHVRVVTNQNQVRNEEELHDLGEQLLRDSFPSEFSPWEFVLLSGVQIDGELSTVIFQRFSHALADGYSNLFLCQRLFGETEAKPPVAARYSVVNARFILTLPYKVIRVFGELAHNSAASFVWKLPEAEKTATWSYHISEQIPTADILAIKRAHNVAFTSVVFALLAGGLHRFFARRPSMGVKTPMPCVITAPVKSHADRLYNQFSFALTSYPVQLSDPLERLREIDYAFEALRDSPVPLIGYYVMLLHGSHFNSIGKILNSYKYCPLVTTYVPVGERAWSLGPHPIKNLAFYLRLQQGMQGAVFCILGFQKHLRIAPVVNGALLSRDEVAELGADILAEANSLLELGISSSLKHKSKVH